MSASARYDFAIGTLFGYFDAAQIVYCLCWKILAKCKEKGKTFQLNIKFAYQIWMQFLVGKYESAVHLHPLG